ncbi:hypothetical protein ABEF93_000046 [Exophiala dermatitidis]
MTIALTERSCACPPDQRSNHLSHLPPLLCTSPTDRWHDSCATTLARIVWSQETCSNAIFSHGNQKLVKKCAAKLEERGQLLRDFIHCEIHTNLSTYNINAIPIFG